MSEEQPQRELQEIMRLLGPPGRMIAFSKRGYDRQHPGHAAVFNANLLVAGVKRWYGDLDLTLDEPLLRQLAARLGQEIAVLYEMDARFATEQAPPRLEHALLLLSPDGSSRFNERSFQRAPDGTLRLRPPVPPPNPAGRVVPYDWDGSRRPRLLRFWRLAHRHVGGRLGLLDQSGHLFYVGARDRGRTPLLLLCLFRYRHHDTVLGLELTCYPSRRPWRRQPLLKLRLRRRHGRIRPYLDLTIQPGLLHTLALGTHLEPRRDGRW